jgi:hypothetical protein
MKLATQTRPARSLEPNGRPSCAVSSNAGSVASTGSGGGTGVRSAQAIGHAARRETTSAQVSGRPTAALIALSTRSPEVTALVAAGILASVLSEDDPITAPGVFGNATKAAAQFPRPKKASAIRASPSRSSER